MGSGGLVLDVAVFLVIWVHLHVSAEGVRVSGKARVQLCEIYFRWLVPKPQWCKLVHCQGVVRPLW